MRENTIKIKVGNLNVRRSTKHFKIGRRCYNRGKSLAETLFEELYKESGNHAKKV